MKETRILYVTHLLAGTLRGGTEVQIEQYWRNISITEGYKIDFISPIASHIDDYDIIHLFNPRANPHESAKFVEKVKERGKRVVITPTFYYNKQDMKYTFRKGVLRAMDHFGPLSKTNNDAKLARVMELADVILPNTDDERSLICDFFHIDDRKMKTIRNGVDEAIYNMKGGPTNKRRDTILFVGRIGPRKHVHTLIEACKQLGIDDKLILVGDYYDSKYYNRCREISNKPTYINELKSNSNELVQAYTECGIFCLPSEYETPGLSALEAAACGSKIVITKNGGTKEYFGDMADYVSPDDVQGLADSILLSKKRELNDSLSQHILSLCNWKAIAKEVVEEYKKINDFG